MLTHNDNAPLGGTELSFENTEIAFRHTSNSSLKRAWWLFKFININFFVKVGPPLTNFALAIHLPVKDIIRKTIFKQFCGGETIAECDGTIKNLAEGSVGTILDYSVEGEEEEEVFDATRDEIIRTIERAKGDAAIPLTVFKITGVGRFALLEKLDGKQQLTIGEQQEWEKIQNRVRAVCQKAHSMDIPVMIDAEESWIQDTIDLLALDMMRNFNRERAIVYNTYQLYRHDKLASLKHDHSVAKAEKFYLGAKLVRGAYMEKERKRAAELNYPSPIQPDKAAADKDYNEALKFCIANINEIAFVAGTHNEDSCRILTELLADVGLDHNHPHVYFSQLLGMSDNLSFNLAHSK